MADPEEVKSAVEASAQSYASQDVDAFFDLIGDKHTEFDLAGGMLFETTHQDGIHTIRNKIKASFENGFRWDVKFSNLDVRLFNDNTALVTGYMNGIITQPSGEAVKGPWRFTEVRVLQGGKWKSVHSHFSRLKTAC
jgi:hypothetical protein